MGVITIKNTLKLGVVVGIQIVEDSDDLLILTSGGKIIRLRMNQISVIGRNTQGRTLVRMEKSEQVVDVARAEASDDEDKEISEADQIEAAGEDQVDDEFIDEEDPGENEIPDDAVLEDGNE
jgi:DNA gyrase subunit A